ncbi:MAG: hypothetical protein QOG35_37 [Solirubrobacteraceae bacterium]|nr:hypothetical protein [Solirubrobacteraceae bacterium]
MRKLVSSVALVAVAAGGALVMPSVASAAATRNCSASVLDMSLGGQPAVSPIVANGGATECRAASAGGSFPPTPLPLTASVLSARTTLAGPAGQPGAQTAGATAELASLSVGPFPSLPVALPAPQVPPTSITVPGPGGPTVDITSALQTLVQPPNVAVLAVQGAGATATGQCAGGVASLTSSSRVLGVAVAGQDLPTDHAVDQVVNLANGAVDPTQLSTSALPAPLNALGDAVVRPLLAALGSIPLPATPLQVRLTPGTETRADGTLTRTALGVSIAVAGNPVLDATIGRASVTQADVCAAVSAQQAVAQASLQCTTRKLTLIDVLQRNGYARLYGAADRTLIGQRVRIVSSWNGKTVATPTVQPDGTFLARGALPPRKLRRTNRARYQAQIGKERSLRLKLFRRMIVTRLSSAGGKVTIKGRVVLPLGRPVQTITIKRRVSCTKNVVVQSLRPDGHGRFAVTIDGPPDQQAAVYRLATKVRKNASNRKLFPTFTLPRAVQLRQ